MLFLNFAWSGVLKIVQNYFSRCLGSRELANKIVHQIDWNLIIPHFKYGVLTTFLSITFQILILEYRYCYFWILQRLGYWKMYKNTFQDVLEAEKAGKQKWVLFFETPCSTVYGGTLCSERTMPVLRFAWKGINIMI